MNGKAPAANAVNWHIVPSGDSCLVVEVLAAPGSSASRWAAAAAQRLRQAGLAGVTDLVSAMRTVAVHYAPQAQQRLAAPGESAYQAAARAVAALLDGFVCPAAGAARVVEIPVCYGGEHGPDLDAVASACGLSPQALVDLHSGAEVEVLMIGFAPGHPYMGMFDARLAPPRRAQPRTAVPAGSVGLANCQSVIYPFVLPGGWNLIGRTPLRLFVPARDPACLLQAGDRVRFAPITAQAFAALEGAQ